FHAAGLLHESEVRGVERERGPGEGRERDEGGGEGGESEWTPVERGRTRSPEGPRLALAPAAE
ncbi:MAG: hypothetical protein ACKOC6_08400, partial [bacterium]